MKSIVTLTLLVLSQVVYAGLLIVGDGCEFTSIGIAIVLADSNDEIRVTNTKNYNENLIVNKSLTLKGGYTTCANAQNDIVSNTKTTINAQNLGNALYIGENNVIFSLSRFILTNGKFQGVSPVDAYGGAVSLTGANLEIAFSDMLIHNSIGLGGGGIMIYAGGNNFVVLDNTLISNNTADNGGGVYCYGGHLYVINGSGIVDNHAIDGTDIGGVGGGLVLEDCHAHLSSGEGGVDLSGHLVGISNNSATGSGGGIYAFSGSIIDTSSFPGQNEPVNIDHNTANTNLDEFGDGGGVYLKDSTIYSKRLFIHVNKVFNGHGGGLYLDNSTIHSNISSVDYNSCYAEGHAECNLLFHHAS